MSKLYKNYVLLKIINCQKYYLFKSGIFCIFIDEDAREISRALNLKLSNLTPDVVKCGFPYSSLDKYMNILQSLGYEIEIVDSKTNSIFNYNTLTQNENVKSILNELSNTEVDKLSISQTYELLEKLKSEALDIIKSSPFLEPTSIMDLTKDSNL